jgi:hypothetical protein
MGRSGAALSRRKEFSMQFLVGLAVILFLVGGLLWAKAWRDVSGSGPTTTAAVSDGLNKNMPVTGPASNAPLPRSSISPQAADAAPAECGCSTTAVNHAQLLGQLSVGVLTGAVVTVGVLLLQLWLQASSEDAVWRANVATAVEIPGFDPAGHSLGGLDLSGKQLPDAELKGADLTGVPLRDTNLTGADLRDANLHGDIMYSANLSTANLTGADLSDAQLQGVRFDDAEVEHAKSFVGAVANAATCWPQGFLELPIAKEITAVPFFDGQGYITSRGQEYPGCLKIP